MAFSFEKHLVDQKAVDLAGAIRHPNRVHAAMAFYGATETTACGGIAVAAVN
jgi:hypothetical protein